MRLDLASRPTFIMTVNIGFRQKSLDLLARNNVETTTQRRNKVETKSKQGRNKVETTRNQPKQSRNKAETNQNQLETKSKPSHAATKV